MLKTFWMVVNLVQYLYYGVVTSCRRFMKWMLRKLTKLTEMQRIMYGELMGSRRIRLILRSIVHSRNPVISNAMKEMNKGLNDGRFDARGPRKILSSTCAIAMCRAKGINIKHHIKFMMGLGDCLEVIFAIPSLVIKMELLRKEPYCNDNPQHEEKLLEIWRNFMAPEELSARKSRQWQRLGFQGNDPATDFRGAGVLALEALLYMSRTYPEISKRLLNNSNHPMFSYPFALLSIQITYMAAELCREGHAATHFYNRAGLILTLDERSNPIETSVWGQELLVLFYEFCTALMIEFDTYWFTTKPKDIMEYGRVKADFDELIKRKLRDDNTCFLMEVRTI